MQTEAGPGEPPDRAEIDRKIGAALEGLSDDELEQLNRLAQERGITVEQLVALAIGDGIEQSQRAWLSDIWKEYFSGLRSLFKRSGDKPAPATEGESGQSSGPPKRSS
jgi:hypothetical protein